MQESVHRSHYRLEEDLPECYEEFLKIANRLEEHYRDMQDMEFTIEDGKLYFLQTRRQAHGAGGSADCMRPCG